jgi:hypothetical protein
MRALVEGHLFLSVGISPTEIELGNEQAVVIGGVRSRYSFQVLAALRALHCYRV